MNKIPNWGLAVVGIGLTCALVSGFLFIAYQLLKAVGVDTSSVKVVAQTVNDALWLVGWTTMVAILGVRALLFSIPFCSRRDILGTVCSGMAILLAYPFIFAVVCQSLYRQFGGFAGAHPNADWTAFAFSWLFDAVTFNASQIWEWLPTPIQPTTWWSETLVWIFCLVSDLIIFAALINLARLAWVAVTGRQQGIEQQG